MADFEMANFKIADFEMADFKMADFKMADFKMADLLRYQLPDGRLVKMTTSKFTDIQKVDVTI
jgi:uncharacterized protein YjbI with pentapeptide repeats